MLVLAFLVAVEGLYSMRVLTIFAPLYQEVGGEIPFDWQLHALEIHALEKRIEERS